MLRVRARPCSEVRKLLSVAVGDEVRPGWWLRVCPAAGEAGGSFRSSLVRPAPERRDGGVDPARSAREAARRARGQLRRYCAANRLNRLGTLTYAGTGCHDPFELRRHVAEFFRGLRAAMGGEAFPYAWTDEWHKTDHGLHVHFAVGQFIPQSLIRSTWGRGYVHIKLLSDLPVGSGIVEEARKAAGYLSKYVGKTFEDERRIPGLHRYELAQGFQPEMVHVWGPSDDDAIASAGELVGHRPLLRRWCSRDAVDWHGPPAVWVQWAG